MRKLTAAVLLVAFTVLCVSLFPTTGSAGDEDAVLLARTIYALAGDESYETMLAIGTVIMNRVDNVWFADTLTEVLNEQMQFPSGTRYSEDSLQAARDVLGGTRVLQSDVVYYQRVNSSDPIGTSPVATIGRFAFYADSIRI